MKLTTKVILILSAIVIAMSITGYYVIKDYQFQKTEVDRQKNNVQVLNKNFKSYKNALGNSVAEVEALNYTVSELKINEAKLYKKLKANDIKPKDVQSIIQVGTSTEVSATVPILYVDSNKCFNYEDAYNKISGCFTTKDSAEVYAEIRDSLDIIPNIVPKHKFLWMQWGVKAIKLNVISQNPFSSFTYSKYIIMP